MNSSQLIGVILAAGKATRMWPFSARYPKPILPVCNKPLIEYQIMEMKGLGITEILIVIGHLGFEISRSLGDGRQYGIRIRYIDQRETIGIAHAVGQLEEYIDRPFLMFLGDIFFEVRDLDLMVQALNEGANAVLAVRDDENPDAIRRNFAVVLNEKGVVKRVIEKPRHAPNRLKGCGLYLFDPHIFDAIRRTPRTAARDEYEITEAIQVLIDDGFEVRIAEVVSFDINVTFPCDLLASNLRQLRRQNVTRVVGDGTQLGMAESDIVRSVIGENVRVAKVPYIRNSLIFSDTVINVDAPIENMIFTPTDIIDCRFK